MHRLEASSRLSNNNPMRNNPLNQKAIIMKAQWIVTAILGLCLLTVQVQAATPNLPLPDETKLIVRSDATADLGMKVQLANLQQRYTRVELKTFDGRTLASKSINNHNGYQVAFDMSKLDDGRYMLQVTQGETTLKQVVLISDGIIRFSAVK